MTRLLLACAALALCACRTQTAADDGGVMGIGYQATSLPTAEPRISLWKLDGLNNRCTSVLLVAGVTPAMPVAGATLPTGWAIDRAWQVSTATGCTTLAPPTGAPLAIASSGTFSFDPSTPTTITVHGGLQFPLLGESLDVDNLAITPASM